jgi:hypothetical protein
MSDDLNGPTYIERLNARIRELEASGTFTAGVEAAAKVAKKFQEPRHCIRRSPSGQCNIGGLGDCTCQEREETAEEIEIAIRALLPPTGMEVVMVPKTNICKNCTHWKPNPPHWNAFPTGGCPVQKVTSGEGYTCPNFNSKETPNAS